MIRFAYVVLTLFSIGCMSDAAMKDTTLPDDTDCIEVPWYPDADGDGWGFQDPAFPPVSVSACLQPTGYSPHASDCDDADPSVNPGAAEIPANGVDENCDGADV